MQIILFDIDKTLLDTQSFLLATVYKIANKFQLPAKEITLILHSYEDSLKDFRLFNYFDLLKLITKEYGIKYKILENFLLNEPELVSKFIYPDVVPTLMHLHKYKLGIFSEGVEEYQRYKLQKSTLMRYLDPNEIYIYPDKRNRKVINSLPKQTIIVDDKLEVIQFLSNFDNIEPIWLSRDKADANIDGIKQISSLTFLN